MDALNHMLGANLPVLVVLALCFIVYYLSKIERYMKAIHFMRKRDFDRQYGIQD